MFAEFVDTPEMMDLFDRTLRGVPDKTQGLRSPIPLETAPALMNPAAENVVYCLAYKNAVRFHAQLEAGLLPTEQRLRDVFHVPTF